MASQSPSSLAKLTPEVSLSSANMVIESLPSSLVKLTLNEEPKSSGLGLFGKLPREIRDQIYHHANPPHTLKSPTIDLSKIFGRRDHIYVLASRMPLLNCSQQLRIECLETWSKSSEAIEFYPTDICNLIRRLKPLINLTQYGSRLGGLYSASSLEHMGISFALRSPSRWVCYDGIPEERVFLYVEHPSMEISRMDHMLVDGFLNESLDDKIQTESIEWGIRIWVSSQTASLVEMTTTCNNIREHLQKRLDIITEDLNNQQQQSQDEYDPKRAQLEIFFVGLFKQVEDMQECHSLLVKHVTDEWPKAKQATKVEYGTLVHVGQYFDF